ncbi:MAG: hypothetical protein AUH94_09735 [Ktedonobacter sp. 13_2_20CM_2_54_8]|nr:MAG: hypothetical protein AUH94_09735 [Ktedonobacter sp. 13_2_20CM_2_54_8]
MSTSGFTLTTSAGQKVTVDEASSTTYQNGTISISASAITNGESVLVLGTVNTTNGTTIAATQVIVQPTGSGGSAASSAAGVVPFQRGAPTTSKQVGQIPANYSQGSGTIVSGTTANKATEAALAAYPGGVVDRVVQLSNGEYEVHNIGVNWPHHVVSAPGRMPGVEERGRRIVRERPDRPLPQITGAPRGIAVRANRRFQGTLLMSFYHQKCVRTTFRVIYHFLA